MDARCHLCLMPVAAPLGATCRIGGLECQADWSKMTARTAGFGPRGEFYSPCPQQRQPSPGMQQTTDTHGYARVAYNGQSTRGVQPDGQRTRDDDDNAHVACDNLASDQRATKRRT